ncbi:MAG: endolytic transglycosylase MltG [Bacteroidales bacterium]|nr:endolytic transglycosylase MltG [Bacteroidales bacterium]
MTRKRHKRGKKSWLTATAVVCVLGLVVWVSLFVALNNKKVALTEPFVLYIPTGSNYSQVMDSLCTNNCLEDTAFFSMLARYKKYPSNVRPGRYVIEPQMSVNALVNKLRSGNQDAQSVTIGKFRTKQALAGRLAKKFEFDSVQMITALNNDSLMRTLGFTARNAIAIFISNTYEFYWNVTPENLIKRMSTEFDNFWNDSRCKKLEKTGLSRVEAITLASIIEEETNMNDEKADIASVYLNRLRKGMLLQADPTVKFALQDFSLRRILNKHLQYDSPYNTYIYKGLPPAPICIPSAESVDAVLENKRTDYYYFCAKEDFSGYHNFANSMEEHNINANKFRKALNKRKIYK